MFDYAPKTEDELELKKGNIVSIINKVCVGLTALRYAFSIPDVLSLPLDNHEQDGPYLGLPTLLTSTYCILQYIGVFTSTLYLFLFQSLPSEKYVA